MHAVQAIVELTLSHHKINRRFGFKDVSYINFLVGRGLFTILMAVSI